jgi:cytochrome c556
MFGGEKAKWEKAKICEGGRKRKISISKYLSFLSILVFSFAILFSIATFLKAEEKSEGEKKVILKRPPKSLDKFYPPQSKNFEFTSKMGRMSSAFQSVFFYLQKGDKQKALSWAKTLRDTYLSIAKDVPEWENYIKKDIPDEFVKAVEERDMRKVSEVGRNLGRTCGSCHNDNELSVKVFYYTPDWSNVEINDPIKRASVPAHKFMKDMTDSLKLAIVMVSDKDFSSAEKFAKDFVERAKALKEVCKDCHTSETSIESLAGKEYFASLDKLLASLKGGKGDEFFSNLGKINSYCTRCHNVHQTPALIRSEME